MQELDFNGVLNDEQKRIRDDFLLSIRDNGFAREDFDYRRYQMDLALKQEFLDAGLYSESYRNYNLGSDQISELTGLTNDEINDYKADAYSDLYVPLLLKYFRAYLVNMSNLCFPANGDWLNVTRGFSKYFYNTGIEGFLPFVNDAWVDIIKTENQRFSLKEKYKTAMAEIISYGNTCIGHTYNPEHHYIEPFVPGIGCVGVYPICDDWRKSNIVFYYDINYSTLLERTDFDQEIIKEIEPQIAHDTTMGGAGYGSTAIKQHYENRVPHGKVRLHEFFIPSFYAKDSKGEAFVAKNVYLTTLIAPFKSPDSELPEEKIYILKANHNVSSVEHGLLLGSFSTNLPGVFYNQGPLQPFLPHQYTANQFISEISRTVGMTTDPPKSCIATGGGMIDPNETPIPDFEAGADYENMEIKSLINLTDASNSLNVYLTFMNYFDKVLEEGTGISKAQMGSMHQGRKTATEIKESYSGSQLNVVEAAANFDSQELQPSIICRIKAEQLILQEQIKQSVIDIAKSEPNVQNEEQAYDMALASNPLFNRLLNYSGIESAYDEYYKKTQAERIEDFKILQEVQQMAQQVQQMLMMADAPIIPPPPIPQREVTNPETGETVVGPSAAEIEQLKQEWIQHQMQQKDQMRLQAKQIEVEMRIKELTFKDVKEPPPPSRRLFYEMLTAPIEDSDVVVTGSMTTVSKELARENLLMLLQSLAGFPEAAVAKIDFDGILMLLARANDIPMRDLLKDQSQILRDEEARKKKAMMQQQMQMKIMEQGPVGAQPPQFGR